MIDLTIVMYGFADDETPEASATLVRKLSAA